MNRRTNLLFLVIGLALLLNVPAAMAQQQYVFPQKGQSAEQQKKDEYECHGWAVKQTGFDPTAAQAPAQPAAQQPAGAQPGSGAKGAVRGAAVGAAVGSLDGEAGKGAAVGATAGAVASRSQSRKQAQQQQAQAQQQASTQQSAKQQDYSRAKGACLEGKGYTVK
jgi:hypothetical protein